MDVSPAGGEGGRAVMLRSTGRVERDSTASWWRSRWGSVGMRSRRVAGDDEDEDGEYDEDKDKLPDLTALTLDGKICGLSWKVKLRAPDSVSTVIPTSGRHSFE